MCPVFTIATATKALAWAVTIHKAQGLTLDKVVIDVEKKEFACGLTFVACSRVRKLTDLLFNPPFPFQRIANLAKSQRLLERLLEDARLCTMETTSLPAPADCPLVVSHTSNPPTVDISSSEAGTPSLTSLMN